MEVWELKKNKKRRSEMVDIVCTGMCKVVRRDGKYGLESGWIN